jgi:hypothetical protein
MARFKFRLLGNLVGGTVVMSGLVVSFALPAEARSWTCQGSITAGTKIVEIPAFGLSGSLAVDRQAKCKAEIKTRFLNNGAIYGLMNFTAAEATPLCGVGQKFFVVYGFDKRAKAWDFSENSKPNCVCTGWSYQG